MKVGVHATRLSFGHLSATGTGAIQKEAERLIEGLEKTALTGQSHKLLAP